MTRNGSIGCRPALGALVAALALSVVGLASTPLLAADPPALDGVVNVNTANVEELQLLPGVGEARASAIISTRKDRGGFKSLDELVEVKGIGDSLLESLRPYVTLSGKTTARRM